MATIRKLRGRWQAQVRRRGVAPRAKSFNTKAEAQHWAQDLEAEANRSGWVADTRLAEKTTLRELLTRYCAEVTPGKRGAVSEASRINSILRCPMSHRIDTTLVLQALAMALRHRQPPAKLLCLKTDHVPVDLAAVSVVCLFVGLAGR